MFLYDYLLEYNRYCNVIGIAVVIFIAALFSKKRAHINYRLVASGIALEVAIGFLALKTATGRAVLKAVSFYANKLFLFADEGSAFVFGNLIDARGPWGFIFGFKVLPVIIFFGALMSLLFYLGIIQRVVSLVSFVIRPILGTTGAETLCAIANSFLGQTDSPLLIRHYLKNMTKSEMLVVMVSGMGTISGSILVVYAAMGVPAEHLLASSVMSIPATILIAKILYPETEQSRTDRAMAESVDGASNIFDAIAGGTSDGLRLALNVAAMLVAFLSLLALLNYMLAAGAFYGNALLAALGAAWHLPESLSLQLIFSRVLAPIGYLLGFSGQEARAAGELIGIKVAVNEMIAYGQMVSTPLSARTTAILTYALCGFSNFSCIGIQIGGIGSLVPERRAWLTELGIYAVLGGTLANIMSAMIAGLLL